MDLDKRTKMNVGDVSLVKKPMPTVRPSRALIVAIHLSLSNTAKEIPIQSFCKIVAE